MDRTDEDFTDAARHVLSFAQEEATRFNHNYIGTEHLLLGILRQTPSAASLALTNLGVELNKVRSAVEFIIGRGDRLVLGAIGLTPRSKHVVELSRDEARRQGGATVGPEHLLLGIIREGGGIASGVLESLGVTLENARAEVIHQIEHPGAPPITRSRRLAERIASVPTLVCRDLSATSSFYEDYLDAREMEGAATTTYSAATAGRLFRLGESGALLTLRAIAAGAAEETSEHTGGVELSFFTRDIVTLWATLQARHAPKLSPLSEAPGERMFTLTDPDGRVLRFYGLAGAGE